MSFRKFFEFFDPRSTLSPNQEERIRVWASEFESSIKETAFRGTQTEYFENWLQSRTKYSGFISYAMYKKLVEDVNSKGIKLKDTYGEVEDYVSIEELNEDSFNRKFAPTPTRIADHGTLQG